MDDDFHDLFIAKYYIGIYSVLRKLNDEQLKFAIEVIERNKIANVSYNNILNEKKIENFIQNDLYHLAFIIGIVSATSSTSPSKLTFYNIMNHYLKKVDKNLIPKEITIPSL